MKINAIQNCDYQINTNNKNKRSNTNFKAQFILSALGDFDDEVYTDAIDYETEFYTQNTLYRLV